MAKSVTSFIMKVFKSGTVLEQMNEFVICLLPKQSNLEFILQFRPICLSNMIIKVVSKIIANRVKRIIGDLAGNW